MQEAQSGYILTAGFSSHQSNTASERLQAQSKASSDRAANSVSGLERANSGEASLLGAGLTESPSALLLAKITKSRAMALPLSSMVIFRLLESAFILTARNMM